MRRVSYPIGTICPDLVDVDIDGYKGLQKPKYKIDLKLFRKEREEQTT